MTKNKNIIRTVIITLILVVIAVMINGFLDGNQDATDKSGAIIDVLENNCDCKTIEQSVYLSGIQFGKDGISKERGEYQLIDCNFTSLEQESERILTILQEKVKNFDELDHLELEFINNDKSKTVVIKNGIIQKPKID